MKTFQSRDDVPVHEKWRLEDLYSNLDRWEQDFANVLEMVKKLSSFDGEIHQAQDLLEYLKLSEELGLVYKCLYVYAMLKVDTDTRVNESQALLERISQVGQQISAATSFFKPFLLSLDESTLKQYLEEVKELTYFEDDLYELYRYKDHVLSKEKEEVLSQMGDALSSPGKTFGMINNADIAFGEVTNDDGEKVSLTRGMYAKLIEDKDRQKRKEAYKAYYKPYVQLQNTTASTLATAVKNNVLMANLRRYPSALEKSLFADEVPKQVYENLIKVTKQNLEPMKRYVRVRKEMLGVDELRAYDLSVPLVDGVKKDISFDEAYETMLESLEPLGNEYVSTLRGFKEKRYIDVRETPGKRSGAYNIGVYGVHPFILLNHRDDLDSLFTLTHECGHGMHSYYSSTHQPPNRAGYSIFVAEVASTVNEVLLIRHLLERTNDKQMKKYLLNHFIDSFKGTMFTQVMFAEFEKITHEKAEAKEPLNADVFHSIYERLFREYHGEELVIDDEVKFGWSRIPHFYRPFYVYKYATGYAAAIHLADQLLTGDQQTLNAYLTFLKSGSADTPLNLLRATGVDLTKPEPIEQALSTFGGLVDEFSAL
ncbi:oligoendopeptidase F [Desertibacillus haloalkaliphilus]|uniref:oligoendopeptidase F n=1 Tax=Desertibacillus haloalkaliphilus TaxID=1328930 RepID=UPI001C279E6F|nr:oligoendopeptidase F [Desertibacillus haloalkaliphilus]MBU8907950.1 oligoendopeptidase F [Desertibacillus haloalkaliphilus]